MSEKKQFFIVKGLVVDNQKRILFIRRKREFHKEAHNRWEFPGGKVEFGESPKNTAKREVKEESGYNIKVEYLLPKLLSSKWVSPERESQQILACYVCKLISGKSNLNDHAVSDIRWFDIKEVPKDFECLPGTIDFLKLYLQGIHK